METACLTTRPLNDEALEFFSYAIKTRRTATTEIVNGTIFCQYGNRGDSSPTRNDLVEMGDRVAVLMALENKATEASKPTATDRVKARYAWMNQVVETDELPEGEMEEIDGI